MQHIRTRKFVSFIAPCRKRASCDAVALNLLRRNALTATTYGGRVREPLGRRPRPLPRVLSAECIMQHSSHTALCRAVQLVGPGNGARAPGPARPAATADYGLPARSWLAQPTDDRWGSPTGHRQLFFKRIVDDIFFSCVYNVYSI